MNVSVRANIEIWTTRTKSGGTHPMKMTGIG
jgi:hypothetical protein